MPGLPAQVRHRILSHPPVAQLSQPHSLLPGHRNRRHHRAIDAWHRPWIWPRACDDRPPVEVTTALSGRDGFCCFSERPVPDDREYAEVTPQDLFGPGRPGVER
jgi:hypothetical protein